MVVLLFFECESANRAWENSSILLRRQARNFDDAAGSSALVFAKVRRAIITLWPSTQGLRKYVMWTSIVWFLRSYYHEFRRHPVFFFCQLESLSLFLFGMANQTPKKEGMVLVMNVCLY